MTRSDQELVEAVLAGDRAAYGVLVARYERAVRAVALRVLDDADLAQDAAQDAFVTAYQKLGTLFNRGAFGYWLLKITRRQAIRLGKKRRKTAPLDDAADRAATPRGGMTGDENRELLDAVTRLPGHERVAVMLRYFEGRSVQEIADITKRPVGTVTKQLSRAHQRLREWMKDEAEP